MTAKKRDCKGRWRSRIVAFRASEEEAASINEAVQLSGMTKQEYLIRKATNRDVVVVGNPRVFKELKNKMEDIYSELVRIKKMEDINETLFETIELVMKIYHGMTKSI